MATHGVIVGNDLSDLTAFERWLGSNAPMTTLAFNQSDPTQFIDSIPYITQQGAAFIAHGCDVMWSVPCPGSGQLENIVNKQFDQYYIDMASRILAAYPDGSTGDILVRLPWEFNLAWQQNAAKDSSGAWNGPLFAKAFHRIRLAFVNPVHTGFERFKFAICPNINTSDYDPLLCFPAVTDYDYILQDCYLQGQYDTAGVWNGWFLSEARGAKWMADKATAEGKSCGFAEYGCDTDSLPVDFAEMIQWQRANCSVGLYWNRSEDIDCRIDQGSLTTVGAIYRAAFG